MITNEFWICGCTTDNLHVMEEEHCHSCGAWRGARINVVIQVTDMVRMLTRYVGVHIDRVS